MHAPCILLSSAPALCWSCSLLLLHADEIDAIFPKRESAQREMERRIVAQMLTCMDDLSAPAPAAASGADGTDANTTQQQGGQQEALGEEQQPKLPPRPHVVVIGATNRPDALDAALRRAGRFDREIALGIPSEAARAKILRVITSKLRLEGDFDFEAVAKRTPGFVGADLQALVKEAAASAVTRIFKNIEARDAEAATATTHAAIAQMLLQQAGEADSNAASAAANGGPAAGVDVTPAAVAHADADAGMFSEAACTAASATATATALAVAAAVAALVPRLGAGPLLPAELQGLAISMHDFECALPKVQPSVRREGFTTTPDVTWADVGSLDEVCKYNCF